MALWTRRKNKQSQSTAPETEVLYLTEAGDNPASAPAIAAAPASSVEKASVPSAAAPSMVEMPVRAPADSEEAGRTNPSDQIASFTNASDVVTTPQVPEPAVTQSTASTSKPEKGKGAKASSKRVDSSKQKSTDVENWRKGVKGRPTQVFIGFLANASKHDAIKYAIGVAEHNATSVENAAYAVFPWNDGWAYEVHEGGPCRAYLPAILRFFDAQNEHARLDEFVVTITTARRSVRVERSHTGLTGFLMPESFHGEQTDWLEPGPKLKPAVPVRLGVLAAGGAIFGTGFIAMLASLMLRPEAPVVTATRQDIPYDQLPVSLWPTLLKASATGYVNALQFSNGKYTFSIAGQANPVEAITAPPPPLPAPLPKDKK